jgi:AcrR family transcriptional regulator
MARKTARKAKSARKAPPSAPPPRGTSDRDKAVDALMALLAEQPFEDIGLAEVAGRAGLKLSQLRAEFGSVMAIFAAHVKDIDRKVLADSDAELADEPARERLFDVLMRRLDMLSPHKAAVRSLLRSVRRNPPLALALNGLAVRSQQWMLAAANIDSSGPRGMLRAQGLAVLFVQVLRVWVDDEDPGLARTMAALVRVLGRGQRLAGMLDDLCRLIPPRCPSLRRRAREAEDRPDETPAAA